VYLIVLLKEFVSAQKKPLHKHESIIKHVHVKVHCLVESVIDKKMLSPINKIFMDKL
jgi:hypothetical protein